MTLAGTFYDPGTEDTHAIVVDWGDGQLSEFTLTTTDGSGAFSASHTYAPGIYTATVVLHDDDGDSTVATLNFQVSGISVADRVLQIVGTNGADEVRIRPAGRDTIHVEIVGRETMTLGTADLDYIVIRLMDGDDRLIVAGNLDVPMLIDGGAGENNIRPGRGRDVVIGGLGSDQIDTAHGEDILIGGTVDFGSAAERDDRSERGS